MKKNTLSGILVYLENENSRDRVGLLTRSADQFCFEYAPEYLNKTNIISLGPEMPLRKEKYLSKILFVPFADRIPPKHNPAYPKYCESVKISVDEKDVFVLLSTLGHRGPSSFVFEGWLSDLI